MYKLIKTLNGEAVIKTNGDGSKTSFAMNSDNTDYQKYLAWLEEGNTPEPADEPADV